MDPEVQRQSLQLVDEIVASGQRMFASYRRPDGRAVAFNNLTEADMRQMYGRDLPVATSIALLQVITEDNPALSDRLFAGICPPSMTRAEFTRMLCDIVSDAGMQGAFIEDILRANLRSAGLTEVSGQPNQVRGAGLSEFNLDIPTWIEAVPPSVLVSLDPSRRYTQQELEGMAVRDHLQPEVIAMASIARDILRTDLRGPRNQFPVSFDGDMGLEYASTDRRFSDRYTVFPPEAVNAALQADIIGSLRQSFPNEEEANTNYAQAMGIRVNDRFAFVLGYLIARTPEMDGDRPLGLQSRGLVAGEAPAWADFTNYIFDDPSNTSLRNALAAGARAGEDDEDGRTDFSLRPSPTPLPPVAPDSRWAKVERQAA